MMNNLVDILHPNTIVTDKNARIVMDSYPHVDSVAFSILINVGAHNESKENMGISHLLEHVLFRKDGKSTIASEMDDLGGYLHAFTSKEYTCFHGKILMGNFDKSFNLLFNHVFNPEFNENDIQLEKSIILEEYKGYQDQAKEQIKIQSIQNIFPGHPFSHDILGTKNSISKITLNDLYEFQERYYTPENTVISLSGNLKEIDVEMIKFFIDSKSNSESSTSILSPTIFEPGIHEILTSNNNQSHIAISYPSYSNKVNQRKAVGLILINVLLTGIKSSVLHNALREEKGFIYSIYSYPSFYDSMGLFQIFTSTSHDSRNEVLNIIQSRVHETLDNGFDYANLQRGKNRLKSEFSFQLEKSEDRMNFFGKKELLNECYYDNFPEVVDSITTMELKNIFNEIFIESPSITIIGE